ncbi:MAG: RluA family pseudouridine synthase [Treponema sp.]|nr:RluA family pseudouridine synthase [Treponema sp.]
MFPPLPEEKAAKVLDILVQKLNSGETELIQVSRVSEERKNQGVMLGVLVCEDENGNEVKLVTNSGISKKLKTENGKLEISFNEKTDFLQFVEPIVSAKKIEEALSENDKKIHELTKKIKSLKDSQEKLNIKNELKGLCAQSLDKVFNLYSFHCIDGKSRPLKDICQTYNKGKLPPTGTGDCCAPKLLDYAFSHKLKPISLSEIKYEKQKAGAFVSPCDERCGILLPAMTGLRILYRDDEICVVNKQSGLLSVPGRVEKDSVETRFLSLFGKTVEIKQPAVHRLDMETSGIMILAFTREAHRELNRQFEAKEIQKEYIALLDGILQKKGVSSHGTMELFFRLDVENRPHQIWDSVNGKSAVTEWQILGVERYHAPDGSMRNCTRVLFMPHTGRTHQLRLASADSHGFGLPIIGDTLYGKCEKGERLMLHAKKISFTHPKTGERMTIECENEF